MMRTYGNLINESLDSINKAMGANSDAVESQIAIAYALIAIAQELHKVNERAEIEIDRQERLQERKDKTKDLGW